MRRVTKLTLSILLAMLILYGLAVPGLAYGDKPVKIMRFERLNPVYAEIVKTGTAREDLTLPETLRVLIELDQADGFVQAEPPVDMSDGYVHYDYYYYGYVSPKDASKRYAAGELVVYSIHYAGRDSVGQPLETVGEIGYRVYGSLGDGDNRWFASDEAGAIFAVIEEIPVTWSDSGYDPQLPGIYQFTAHLSGYKSDQPALTEILVEGEEPAALESFQPQEELEDSETMGEPEENEEGQSSGSQDSPLSNPEEGFLENELDMPVREDCHCGPKGRPIDEDNLPWAHQEDCPFFSPIECMCREKLTAEHYDSESGQTIRTTYDGELTHVHDPENGECPLHGHDTIRFKRTATGEKSVMDAADADRIIKSQEEGVILYPVLGEIELIEGSQQKGAASTIQPFSQNGGGPNDVAQDALMTTNTPTSGNGPVTSGNGAGTPGVWVDYLNTIWMNKAFNQFAWTPAASTGAHNNWAWGGGTATQTSGTVTTNALRIPSQSGNIWEVYSGEQLRYALRRINDVDNDGHTVKLMADINLNGSNFAWNVGTGNNSQPKFARDNRTIDGNGFTLYNAGGYATSGDVFIFGYGASGGSRATIRDLTIRTAKLVGRSRVAPIITHGGATNAGHTYTNVHVIDSMAYSTGDVVAGFGSLQVATANRDTTVSNCSVQGGYLRGRDHALGFAGGTARTIITNSFVVDTLINGYGGHSSGFIYCNHANPLVQVSNSFASTEIYGAKYVIGFGAPFGSGSTIQNCFATGKIEGYEYLSGFAATQSSGQLNSYSAGVTYNNCYTTSLVGMRSEAKNVGGFIAFFPGGDGARELPASVNNSYAAGEVGDFTTDLSNPVHTGGFVATTNPLFTFNRTYYDKQTTAMREWTAGNQKTVTGVTGVLTSNTVDSNGDTVTGLAGGAPGSQGFTGFANNSNWVFSSDRYPQLGVFANASSGFGGYTDLVKAYSLASTATVFLNTWNKGYDWSDVGVRTSDEVTYARTLASTGKTDHKGNELTYDTVREIISPFTVTPSSTFSHLVGNGAPSSIDGTNVTNTVVIDNASHQGTVSNPGMDWYRISAQSGEASGFRPIRLIGYMDIDAGLHQEIAVGHEYNHRTDVKLTMMDSLTQNMIIGMDDSKIWSTSKTGGYPASDRYYAAVTDNMETDFSASKDAWLYTEIWRAKQDSDGNYEEDPSSPYVEGALRLVPDHSVWVTGTGTGSNSTLDEKKWNGDLPFYPDFSHERKYIISYYWMLSDGRYVTDYKVVTVMPGAYDLKLDVLNYESGLKTDSADPNSLLIGTGQDVGNDPGYTLSATPQTHHETLAIPYTRNAAAGWVIDDPHKHIVKTQVDFYDLQGNSAGTAVIDKELEEGDELEFSTMVYYVVMEYDSTQQKDREVTKAETLDIVYTVSRDAQGKFQLRFNKLKNVPSFELAAALEGENDDSGIPAGALAYINDMMFNTQITLWTRSGMDFEFTKTDGNGGLTFGAGDAEFKLYSCTKGHTAPGQHSPIADGSAGNCWGDPVTVSTDADGKVIFPGLFSGHYMLVESQTKDGFRLPEGQWLVMVNAETQTITFELRGAEPPPAFEIDSDGDLKLRNYAYFSLPETGGQGTSLVTGLGIGLIGLTLLGLIAMTRLHRRKEEDLA